jgi:hypothetical protein
MMVFFFCGSQVRHIGFYYEQGQLLSHLGWVIQDLLAISLDQWRCLAFSLQLSIDSHVLPWRGSTNCVQDLPKRKPPSNQISRTGQSTGSATIHFSSTLAGNQIMLSITVELVIINVYQTGLVWTIHRSDSPTDRKPFKSAISKFFASNHKNADCRHL